MTVPVGLSTLYFSIGSTAAFGAAAAIMERIMALDGRILKRRPPEGGFFVVMIFVHLTGYRSFI